MELNCTNVDIIACNALLSWPLFCHEVHYRYLQLRTTFRCVSNLGRHKRHVDYENAFPATITPSVPSVSWALIALHSSRAKLSLRQSSLHKSPSQLTSAILRPPLIHDVTIVTSHYREKGVRAWRFFPSKSRRKDWPHLLSVLEQMDKRIGVPLSIVKWDVEAMLCTHSFGSIAS